MFLRDNSYFPSTNTDTFQDIFFIISSLIISNLTCISRLQRMPNLTSQHDNDYYDDYDNDDCDVVFLRVNNYNSTHLGSGFAKVFKVILASCVF
jgi:hypothetical protein